MICPRCGSNRVTTHTTSETTTSGKTKGFGWIKACLGYLFFNIPGILCGLCGMGRGRSKTTTRTKVIHVCQDCGRQL